MINFISLLLPACFIIMTCVFSMPSYTAEAAQKDEFLSGFQQTVYDQENGLGSAEVNCIYQTRSGYIWIGTDGGLYRFNGKEFKVFNLWDTDKDDIYFINSLFQDSKGRLWVGTANYGLFYIEGSTSTHFTREYYDGIKCINDVTETADGTIYVATSSGLYHIDEDNTGFVAMDRLNGRNVRDLTTAGGQLWGIVNGSSFFLLSEQGNIVELKASGYTQEELSCILGLKDGSVYIGTMGTEILHMARTFRADSFSSGKDGINYLYHDGERLFVCADSGMGYFGSDSQFHALYDTLVNRYISSMMMDYEGSYWFASSRYGLLQLGLSKFRNYNEFYGISGSSANCIIDNGNETCIGTDEGLIIINSDGVQVENDLTKYLSGASVKHLMRDSAGNLWVSTSRKYGVVCQKTNGTIVNYGRGAGLPTNLVNCTLELNDGTIAVATEAGISILSRAGEHIKSMSYGEGLNYPDILCLYQDEKDRLFAGSDGGGLYIIDENKVLNYTEEKGLTSNVVSAIVPGKNGIWIGTDNGLSIFTEGIRAVSNIDFSNNIYDLQAEEEDESVRLWVIGSKGVISATEEELLGSSPLGGRYLAGGDGLNRRITINSRSMLKDQVLYLCSSNGVQMLNTKDILLNETAPRLTVSEIDVDENVYHLDQIGGSLTIPSDTQRLSIAFSVLSYVNRENINVEYKLEGFDSAPITISPSDPMQAVYTNLAGGTYTFTVRALNGDGVPCVQDITFTIGKELGFFERSYVRIGIICIAAIVVIFIFGIILSYRIRMRGQDRKLKRLEKEHEVAVRSSYAKTDFLAHMSNEIKIPVNAIISLAGTMQQEQDEEVRQEGLQAIATSGREILGKVDETIQLARLESGRISVVNASYSLTTLVCDISDRMINALGQKPVRFLVDLGEKIPDIMVGDYDKIRNILEILLDNAAKYTREGTITLFVDCYDSPEDDKKHRLSFSISDTGIGIRKDRLEHIFEVYNIADNKKQTGYSGSGISLAIAKQLTEIMGGEIDVESTFGAGSTFTVNLLQEKTDQNVVTAAASADAELRVSSEEAERMIAPEVSALIVDDVEISRTVAVNVLHQLEIKADAADSGMQAIDMIMNGSYDIVFMDLAMPVMNGTDTMREIRELEREDISDVPIIAMTEDAINEDPDALKNAGFTDLMIKPIELSILATFLQKYYPEKLKYRTRVEDTSPAVSRMREEQKELEPVLDVNGVLDKIGGNEEMYHRILSTFYTQNRNAPDELRQMFSGKYQSFRSRIHNIRNGAQNIGAAELLSHIVRIDSAINIGNKAYVRDSLPALIIILEEVLDVIGRYLEKFDPDDAAEEEEMLFDGEEAPSGKPERKPVQRDQVSFEKLDEALHALESEDMDTLSAVLDDISLDIYGTEDTEFLQALRQEVNERNMDGVADMIGTYKELKK